jgi:hypothetical protein
MKSSSISRTDLCAFFGAPHSSSDPGASKMSYERAALSAARCAASSCSALRCASSACAHAERRGGTWAIAAARLTAPAALRRSRRSCSWSTTRSALVLFSRLTTALSRAGT